jgi:hypothetical protein
MLKSLITFKHLNNHINNKLIKIYFSSNNILSTNQDYFYYEEDVITIEEEQNIISYLNPLLSRKKYEL